MGQMPRNWVFPPPPGGRIKFYLYIIDHGGGCVKGGAQKSEGIFCVVNRCDPF